MSLFKLDLLVMKGNQSKYMCVLQPPCKKRNKYMCLKSKHLMKICSGESGICYYNLNPFSYYFLILAIRFRSLSIKSMNVLTP